MNTHIEWVEENWMWFMPLCNGIIVLLQIVFSIFNGSIQEFGLACLFSFLSGFILWAMAFLTSVVLYLHSLSGNISWYWGAGATFIVSLFTISSWFADLSFLR